MILLNDPRTQNFYIILIFKLFIQYSLVFVPMSKFQDIRLAQLSISPCNYSKCSKNYHANIYIIFHPFLYYHYTFIDPTNPLGSIGLVYIAH